MDVQKFITTRHEHGYFTTIPHKQFSRIGTTDEINRTVDVLSKEETFQNKNKRA